MIGVIQPQKGQELLVRLVGHLRRSGIDAYGWIIGEAQGKDHGYRTRLEQIIRNENLEDAVWMLGARADIPDLLKAVSFVFIPSEEGYSLVALEAMAAGVPVVALATGGAAEQIRMSGAGTLFADTDGMDVIAAKVLSAMRDKQGLAKGTVFASKQSLVFYGPKILAIFQSVTERTGNSWRKKS